MTAVVGRQQFQHHQHHQQQQPTYPSSSPSMNLQTDSARVTSSAYTQKTAGGHHNHHSLMSSPSMVEMESRRIRSVVLGEELLGPKPEESVRYVEVPYVEEVVRHVPRKEYVEIEKRVPKFEYEYVDRILEVPQIEYVDRTVEVPQIQEVVRHVPRREYVDVPREVLRHVPKIETKVVEKVVEVPGQVIEVPKPYTVENKVPVAHYVNKEIPIIVSQTVRPLLTESKEAVDCEVCEYEPEIIPVDIHVPKAVPSKIVSVGVVNEEHRVVRVPDAQYNSMLRLLNPHIVETDATGLPYISDRGAIPFLASTEQIPHTSPAPGVQIIGFNQNQPIEAMHRAARSSVSKTSKRSGTTTTTWRGSSSATTLGRPRSSKNKKKGGCPC